MDYVNVFARLAGSTRVIFSLACVGAGLALVLTHNISADKFIELIQWLGPAFVVSKGLEKIGGPTVSVDDLKMSKSHQVVLPPDA